MKRFDAEKNKVVHKVTTYPYTIVEQKTKVRDILKGQEKVPFTEVIFTCENKVHAIYTFLGILELLQEQIIRLTLGMGYNNFWLSEVTDTEVA